MSQSADSKLQRLANSGWALDKQDPAQRILYADSIQTAGFNGVFVLETSSAHAYIFQ